MTTPNTDSKLAGEVLNGTNLLPVILVNMAGRPVGAFCSPLPRHPGILCLNPEELKGKGQITMRWALMEGGRTTDDGGKIVNYEVHATTDIPLTQELAQHVDKVVYARLVKVSSPLKEKAGMVRHVDALHFYPNAAASSKIPIGLASTNHLSPPPKSHSILKERRQSANSRAGTNAKITIGGQSLSYSQMNSRRQLEMKIMSIGIIIFFSWAIYVLTPKPF